MFIWLSYVIIRYLSNRIPGILRFYIVYWLLYDIIHYLFNIIPGILRLHIVYCRIVAFDDQDSLWVKLDCGVSQSSCQWAANLPRRWNIKFVSLLLEEGGGRVVFHCNTFTLVLVNDFDLRNAAFDARNSIMFPSSLSSSQKCYQSGSISCSLVGENKWEFRGRRTIRIPL